MSSKGDARALPWLVVGYAGATISEWAVLLAVLVETQQRAGNAAAGWVALGLLSPALLGAPFAARTFDGARPIRSLAVVYAVQATAAIVASVAMATDAPLAVVLVPGALAMAGITFVRPAFTAISPGIVSSAREFATSSLVGGYCDSTSVLVGPLLATVLLSWHGTPSVLVAVAGMAIVGLVGAVRLLPFDRVSPPHDGTARPSVAAAVRAVGRRRHVPALLSVLAAVHVLMGVLSLMFVVLAAEDLDMGTSGAAVLNTAFGIGALVSVVGVTVVVRNGRVAPAAVLALSSMTCAVLVLGAFPELSVALLALPLAGFGRSLLDVTARMLLMRAAPPQYVASLCSIFEILIGVGTALGIAFGQLALAVTDAPGGLIALGAVLALLLAVTVGSVWRSDQLSEVPLAAVALLRSNRVLAPLPPGELEIVARAASERAVAPGETLIREGEPGDSYFVVASGELEVSIGGRTVRTLRRTDGVGEVALLTDAPRSATVVARTGAQVLEIDRASFLASVTGNAASYGVAWTRLAQLEYA
ncbi:MAG: cyclic nucleotide-binding domain-containing protein [Actinobacteria bacterium]|nr:cyclic nucleotide-binding domain-containing protein [Actinomycetota bacterium]